MAPTRHRGRRRRGIGRAALLRPLDRPATRLTNDQWAVDRGGPPPTRNVPGQPFSKAPPLPQGGIIGLFPEPGAPR